MLGGPGGTGRYERRRHLFAGSRFSWLQLVGEKNDVASCV